MRELLWSNTFRRALRRTVKRRPHLLGDIEATLQLLQVDPFAAQLATHKLKGRLAGSWSCSAGYDLRIIFQYVRHKGSEAILLEAVGSHDDVY